MNFDRHIIIDTYQNYAAITGCNVDSLSINGCLKDGYTIIDGELYIVLYNDQVHNREHLNWTLAHEIGHIYLGHTTDGKTEEVEAHWFAAELLAPEPLIRYMIHDVGMIMSSMKIQEIFGLSWMAAEKRYSTISRKNVWLTYLSDELKAKYHTEILNLQRSEFNVRGMLKAVSC